MTLTPYDMTLWDPSQAVAWVSGQVEHPSDDWTRMCLALTSCAYGYGGSGVNSANDYWDGSWHKHPGDRSVPTGGLACFSSSSAGHIMTCVDGATGTFASNDIYRTGYVDYCTIADIERAWGQPYLGWAEPCYWAGWGTNPDTPPPSTALKPEDDMTPEQANQLANIEAVVNWINAWKDQIDPGRVNETYARTGWINEWKDGIDPVIRLTAEQVSNLVAGA